MAPKLEQYLGIIVGCGIGAKDGMIFPEKGVKKLKGSDRLMRIGEKLWEVRPGRRARTPA